MGAALGAALERSSSLASVSVDLFLGTSGGEPGGGLGSGAKCVGGGPGDCLGGFLGLGAIIRNGRYRRIINA